MSLLSPARVWLWEKAILAHTYERDNSGMEGAWGTSPGLLQPEGSVREQPQPRDSLWLKLLLFSVWSSWYTCCTPTSSSSHTPDLGELPLHFNEIPRRFHVPSSLRRAALTQQWKVFGCFWFSMTSKAAVHMAVSALSWTTASPGHILDGDCYPTEERLKVLMVVCLAVFSFVF